MAEAGCNEQRIKLETGTDKIDKVALRDLAFWLPLTEDHLRDGIPIVRSYSTYATPESSNRVHFGYSYQNYAKK